MCGSKDPSQEEYRMTMGGGIEGLIGESVTCTLRSVFYLKLYSSEKFLAVSAETKKLELSETGWIILQQIHHKIGIK